jgi:bifunctional UDP-N-acetylglucosamine pyrophosphorylase / glucosamine-1-phosphate N-acetyltransferase
VLRGECSVATGAEVGPDCTLTDTRVGERAEVRHTVAERAVIGARARVGPFAVLGPGAVVGDDEVVPPFAHVPAPGP